MTDHYCNVENRFLDEEECVVFPPHVIHRVSPTRGHTLNGWAVNYYPLPDSTPSLDNTWASGRVVIDDVPHVITPPSVAIPEEN